MKDTPVSTGPRLPTQELIPEKRPDFSALYGVNDLVSIREVPADAFGSSTIMARMITVGEQNGRIQDAAQQLVALAECIEEPLPEPLVASLANLHAALAGPGPSALDARPQSLEIIGDAGLHARALAEAKAREMGRDQDIIRAIEALPVEVRHAAEGYDTLRAAHQEELFLSYQQGLDTGMTLGYDNALRHIASQPLWRVALNRFQAWWSAWTA